MSNPTCYRGHSLKCESGCEEWTCNICEKLYSGPRFGCHEPGCDYDVCYKCTGRVNNIVCPKHHLLMIIIYNGEWVCNNHINGPVFRDGRYMGCNQAGCDYGLCDNCSSGLIPIHMPKHRRVSRCKIFARRLNRMFLYSLSVGLAIVGVAYTPQ